MFLVKGDQSVALGLPASDSDNRAPGTGVRRVHSVHSAHSLNSRSPPARSIPCCLQVVVPKSEPQRGRAAANK